MGIICIRLSKLYFGMLQISIGSLVWAIVYRWYSFTGGDNGIYGIPIPDILSSYQGAYYFTLISHRPVALRHVQDTEIALWKRSPGDTRQPCAECDDRDQCEEASTPRPCHFGFLCRSGRHSLRGRRQHRVPGYAVLDLFPWRRPSCAFVGGWLTFLGSLLGAAIIVAVRTIASTYTVYWGLVLGIMFVLVIFFLPNGVLGWIEELYSAEPSTLKPRGERCYRYNPDKIVRWVQGGQ